MDEKKLRALKTELAEVLKIKVDLNQFSRWLRILYRNGT